MGVVVSIACWSRYKSTPQASRCWMVSSKSLSERPRRSIAHAITISNFLRLASAVMAPVVQNASVWPRHWASLALDVRRLDDRPPLLDFGLLEGGQRLRRLLLARRHFEPEFGKAPTHGRIGQGLHDRRVEPVYDILRRALGHPESIPKRGVKTLQPGLVHGCDIGCGCEPAPGRDRIGLDSASAQVRQEIRRRLDHEVDLTGDQVLHGRPVAAIGHELEARAGLLLKQEAGHMTGGAYAGDAS